MRIFKKLSENTWQERQLAHQHSELAITNLDVRAKGRPGKRWIESVVVILKCNGLFAYPPNHRSTLVMFLVLIFRWRNAKNRVKVGVLGWGWPASSLFNNYNTEVQEKGATPFLGLLHFTFDPYLIMLSVKKGSIKYHFVSLLWLDLRLNPESPEPVVNTLPLGQWPGIKLYLFS